MPCYRPIPARQDKAGGAVVLHPLLGTSNMSVPCGGCVGCLTMRATEWARRCGHEASRSRHNVFATLTYDDSALHPRGWLEPEEMTKFIKRLRKYVASGGVDVASDDEVGGVRYFYCGEYGGLKGRPHYHALLFNCSFADAFRVGVDLYESPRLSELWRFGSNRIGSATPAAANYIAQYSLKKQAARSDCDEDGVVRPAPFLRMSQSLGASWVEAFKQDLSGGFLVSDGKRGRIPRAYVNRLRKVDPGFAEEVEYRKYLRAVDDPGDRRHPDRVVAAEFIHEQKKRDSESRRSLLQ